MFEAPASLLICHGLRASWLTEFAPDIEVLGSIPAAHSKVSSREPVVQFVQCQGTQEATENCSKDLEEQMLFD